MGSWTYKKLSGFVACALVGSTVTAFAQITPSEATVTGSVPSWATQSNVAGNATASDVLDLTVDLKAQNQQALESYAAAVSTPGNAAYGHYLTNAQFNASFGASSSDVAAVRAYLEGRGFTVTDVSADNLSVSAEATVAQVDKAFAVQVKVYRVGGQLLRATAVDPTLPGVIAGKVVAVEGLSDQFSTYDHIVEGSATSTPALKPPPVFEVAPPCSAYFGQKVATKLPKAYGQSQPYAVCGYTPAQLTGAYGTSSLIKAGFDGKGQTVAIIDAYASPTMLADANQYSDNHGLPEFKSGQYKQLLFTPFNDISQCGGSGWWGEESLDVESVHSMAPGANVLFVGAKNCAGGLTVALRKVVAGHLADIVSNSYGEGESGIPASYVDAINQVLVEAAVKGISVLFSAGDSAGVIFPSSDPWATAVGGTSLAVGKTDNYLFQTGWGTAKTVYDAKKKAWSPAAPGPYDYGTGGGLTTLFDEPTYQKGVVPASLSGNAFGGRGSRVTPDIAMDADPSTGFLMGETQLFPNGKAKYSEYRIGGTSLASPLLAGLQAVTNQVMSREFGFLNPAIYKLSKSGGLKALQDIVGPAKPVAEIRNDWNSGISGAITTSLRTMNQFTFQKVTKGYDDATGVGTPTKNYVFDLGQ